MDAAIWATCSGECVRAFFAYGTNRSVGQISMRRAIAGKMEELISAFAPEFFVRVLLDCYDPSSR
jgi:hypothetical protein